METVRRDSPCTRLLGRYGEASPSAERIRETDKPRWTEQMDRQEATYERQKQMSAIADDFQIAASTGLERTSSS